MKRGFLRGVLVFIALLVMACIAAFQWRDPEKGPITDDDRADAKGKFVALDAGLTYYELSLPADSADTGRVVVLVHGFSVPAYIWDSTVVALTTAGRRVLRYDMYGRGLSDRPDAAYDGAMYDTQLAELLDSLRIRKPVDLVGLSFGGYVVAHFSGTHRSRVNTLTMVDPVSAPRTLPRMVTLPLIGRWAFQMMVVPGMAGGQSSDFLHPERFPGWPDLYRPQMRFDGFGRALLRSSITTSRTDFGALFAAVAKGGVPTLLIWGKQDPTLPFTNSESVKTAIPALTFVPVDSSGHLPHMEQSAATHTAMLAFFAKNP